VRLLTYLRSYGEGGPNGRMRRACPPALRRLGIEPFPEWAARKRPPTLSA
jgi:hypothetical protein